MTKIALLCPTRGRPQQIYRMIRSVERTTTTPVMVSLYLSNDDPALPEYDKLNLTLDDDTIAMVGPSATTVHAWNKLAVDPLLKDVKLFMLGADDIVFETPGWDAALIKHYEGLENKIHVYHLQDSRDPDGTPHPIVTREYIDAMGYFIPPIFLHWYCDTWTVAISRSVGAFTHLKGFGLTHDKPSDRGQPDATHIGIRARGWPQRDKYVNDTCQHFLQFEKERLARIIGNTASIAVSSKEELCSTFNDPAWTLFKGDSQK